MKQFEVGKTYYTRSIGDHDCIYTLEVISRSAKMVTVKSNVFNKWETRRFKVYECDNDGIERVALGRYSFAPMFKATETSAR